MDIQTALDEFGLLQRRRHRGDRGQVNAAALGALGEYLIGYSGYEDSESITPEDLLEFLLEYYPAQEEPDPDVALNLLEVAGEFSLWLLERGERGTATFAADLERLRVDIPRVFEALVLLREYVRKDDLAPPVMAEEAGQLVGELGSGVDRVARLDQLDYTQAETDDYHVARVDEGALELASPTREALGIGPASPVTVPPAAAERLRTGDRIQAEIAPGPAGWELLEIFGIRPRP
jgi:hypothetical protein